MIQRLLWHIAGVDRATLATCPVTDKVWAAHLGFSLVLSFTVVLGISFHATGYVIADPWVRKITGYAVSTGRGISPLLGVQNSPLGGVGDQPLM